MRRSSPHHYPSGFCSAIVILVLVTITAHANNSPHQHPNHKNGDESIDVSSSIGVSHDGSDHSSGLVEDLLANESTGEPVKVSVSGPALFPNAAVVDSDSDLIGAESESKFSLSKLKRPFSRLPFDLRFNNRFLNGAAASFLASGSNPAPQMVRSPPPQQGLGPMRHPNFVPRPQHFGGGNVPHRPNFPATHQSGPAPVYKSINFAPSSHGSPPPPPPPQQQQQQPHLAPPQHNMPPPSGHSNYGDHGEHMADHSSIMHSIADFINEEHRQNEGSVLNDFDNNQALSSPSNDIWPLSQPELAKIVQLDVKCEKNFMKVSVEFDRPFNGIIFSKGHFSSPNCIHLPAGSGRSHVYFDIRMDSCGTVGNMGVNQLAQMGNNAGNFFENILIFQYDPFVQEAWDQARKLRCTWHDHYEKSVSFRPFPVDMVDVVRADFAGDNVGCWMQIQVGRGPWASEVAGIVKIGQTMTMVLAIKDEENKFDMLVRNCVAHDGKRAPIELVDTHGCIVRSKLMSKFTKIKNFGSSASVLSYAHFQAFKFPDSMEVHFQCTIQICKNSCPEQCDQSGNSNVHYVNHQISGTINTQTGSIQNHQPDSLYISSHNGGEFGTGHGDNSRDSVLARPREIRDVSRELQEQALESANATNSKEVGLNKVIRVVSTGDLSFATSDKLTSAIEESPVASNQSNSASGHYNSAKSWLSEKINEKICMSSINFIVCFAMLFSLMLISCSCSAVLCCRRRSFPSKCAKSAKEATLTKKGQRKLDNDYASTVIPVMAGHSYLSSSSVLSPRAQASNAGYRSDMMYSN